MRGDAENPRDFLRREPALLGELRVVELAAQLVVLSVGVDQHDPVRLAGRLERLAQAVHRLTRHVGGHLEHAGRALGSAFEERERVPDQLVRQADHPRGLRDG